MLVKLFFFILFFSLIPAQGTYNLYSPYMELPSIGDGETMHFGFYLHADIPDSDGDNDTYLDDYYDISILGFLASTFMKFMVAMIFTGFFIYKVIKMIKVYLKNKYQYFLISPTRIP